MIYNTRNRSKERKKERKKVRRKRKICFNASAGVKQNLILHCKVTKQIRCGH